MPKRFKLTDDSINNYGFRILTAGIDLEQFRKNPVMLYDHNDYEHLPIGRWENIAIEADGLFADAVFDMKDVFAAQIAQKVEDGIINMVSIGIRPIEESADPDLMVPGQQYPTISRAYMKEASITPFGANSNALALYDENGKVIQLSDTIVKKFFIKNQPENPMKLILLKMKLNETASEQDAVAAIETLELRASNAETELTAYKLKESDAKKAEAITLVDAAIAEQRINASSREILLKAFDADFEGQKTILASIPKRTTAKETVEAGEAGQGEKVLKLSWDEADKAGVLPELKEKHLELFKAKFKEKYKKEYGS